MYFCICLIIFPLQHFNKGHVDCSNLLLIKKILHVLEIFTYSIPYCVYLLVIDGANWLTFFCQPVRSWNGLVLRKPIDMEKRELIQNQEATLLDLRSYLFSRQCTLLIFLQRPWEVSQRALELLHNCVQELKLLEVSLGNSIQQVIKA